MLLGAAAKADASGKNKNGLDNDRNIHDDNSDDDGDIVHHYPYSSPSRPSGVSESEASDTYSSYNSIAQIMEKKDMKTIMTVFAEKILLNLAYTKP